MQTNDEQYESRQAFDRRHRNSALWKVNEDPLQHCFEMINREKLIINECFSENLYICAIYTCINEVKYLTMLWFHSRLRGNQHT